MSGKIEYVDVSWNPITGCSKISPGCKHCWAERMAKRFKGRYGYPAHDPFAITRHADHLDDPAHWRKPRRIAVCWMGDIFHEDIPEHWRWPVFRVMSNCPQHQFLLLTKRSKNMRELVSRGCKRADGWPAHIWLGVSIELERELPNRLTDLLRTPVPHRFVSFEPLLGSMPARRGVPRLNGLTQIIIGGESGPGARPCNVAWIYELIRQGRTAGVPVFVKQLGANVIDENGKRLKLEDSKGGDMAEWPDDLRVREWASTERKHND